jgi:hypothetical protein
MKNLYQILAFALAAAIASPATADESLSLAVVGNVAVLTIEGATTATEYAVILTVDGASTKTGTLSGATYHSARAKNLQAGELKAIVTWGEAGSGLNRWVRTVEVESPARFFLSVDEDVLRQVLEEQFTPTQANALKSILDAAGEDEAEAVVSSIYEWGGTIRDGARLEEAILGAGFNGAAVSLVRQVLLEARERERVATVQATESEKAQRVKPTTLIQ